MGKEGRIPTNLRTLMILEVLGRAGRALTPTEINTEIGLPKQTIHRLCKTLIAEGYLRRELLGNRLLPGRRLRMVGAGILHGDQVHIARHQVLQKVAEEVSETVNFVVPEDTGMHYTDRVDTDWPLRIQLPIGSNVPFHCTASGKAFMASLSRTARRRLVQSLDLKPYTPHTHTDAARLLDDLETIAKRGYSTDNEEFMDGMIAIAVPVRDPSNRFVAALAFHGPTQRVSLDDAVRFSEVLDRGAAELNAALFS